MSEVATTLYRRLTKQAIIIAKHILITTVIQLISLRTSIRVDDKILPELFSPKLTVRLKHLQKTLFIGYYDSEPEKLILLEVNSII